MARERYLLHAGEDTIHDPEAEKKAEQSDRTPHGKWDNFWYYHKWHIVLGVAAVLVVVWLTVSTLQTVKPDYTVGMLTQKTYPEAMLDSFSKEIAKYGKDLNGDGKVVVQIVQYSLPVQTSSGADSLSSVSSQRQDVQMLQVYQAKFVADLTSGTSMIFITDNESFQHQEKTERMFAYLDGRTPPDNAVDFDNMRIAFEKCPRHAGMNLSYQIDQKPMNQKLTDLMKNYSISLRCYKGTAIDGKQDSYYNASRELFQKLRS